MTYQVSPMRTPIKERVSHGRGDFLNPMVGWMRLCQSSDYETIVSLVRYRILEQGLFSQGVLSSISYCFPPLYNPIVAWGSAGKKSTQGVG